VPGRANTVSFAQAVSPGSAADGSQTVRCCCLGLDYVSCSPYRYLCAGSALLCVSLRTAWIVFDCNADGSTDAPRWAIPGGCDSCSKKEKIVPGFAVRLAVNVFGLWVASEIVPGMEITGLGSFVLAGFLFGVVNALARPVAILLTLPFTIVTLGAFLLVINAAMLGLVAWFLDSFVLTSFWAAFFGSIVVSLASAFASQFIGPRGNVEVMVVGSGSRR
jgi:putative membrane protein